MISTEMLQTNKVMIAKQTKTKGACQIILDRIAGVQEIKTDESVNPAATNARLMLYTASPTPAMLDAMMERMEMGQC